METNSYDGLKLHSVKYSFIEKLLNMLQSRLGSKIIGWDGEGVAIVILDPKLFVSEVLSHYYTRPKLETFIRQLNVFQFECFRYENTAIEFPQMLVCMHPFFQRNRPELLDKITKRSYSFEDRELPIAFHQLDPYFSQIVICRDEVENRSSPNVIDGLENQRLVDTLVKIIISASVPGTKSNIKTKDRSLLPPFQDPNLPTRLRVHVHPRYSSNESNHFAFNRSRTVYNPKVNYHPYPSHIPQPQPRPSTRTHKYSKTKPAESPSSWVRYKLFQKTKEFKSSNQQITVTTSQNIATTTSTTIGDGINNSSVKSSPTHPTENLGLKSDKEPSLLKVVPTSATNTPISPPPQSQVVETKVIRHDSLTKSKLGDIPKENLKHDELNDIFSVANLCSTI